jgi:hypothetical protein
MWALYVAMLSPFQIRGCYILKKNSSLLDPRTKPHWKCSVQTYNAGRRKGTKFMCADCYKPLHFDPSLRFTNC